MTDKPATYPGRFVGGASGRPTRLRDLARDNRRVIPCGDADLPGAVDLGHKHRMSRLRRSPRDLATRDRVIEIISDFDDGH